MLSRVARSGAARAGFATAAASSDASSPGVRGAFRTVVALGLAGATAFVVEDTLRPRAVAHLPEPRGARHRRAPAAAALTGDAVPLRGVVEQQRRDARPRQPRVVRVPRGRREGVVRRAGDDDSRPEPGRRRVPPQPRAEPREPGGVARVEDGGHPPARARGRPPGPRQPPAGPGTEGGRPRRAAEGEPEAVVALAEMARRGEERAMTGVPRSRARDESSNVS